MLRVSYLIAAAITSHCISLFYGHEQVWNSRPPYGVSLETSASILFTTSEPGLFPTVGGVCIVNMLWLMSITSQISRGREWIRLPVRLLVFFGMQRWCRWHFLNVYWMIRYIIEVSMTAFTGKQRGAWENFWLCLVVFSNLLESLPQDFTILHFQ